MHFDGLMIETHPDPDNAWSDAKQQVTPAALKLILDQLIIRDEHSADMTKSMELEYLRQVMDSLDAEIIDLIARRMELSERMGSVKKDCHITAYQPERWREIVETRTAQARKHGLAEDFIVAIYDKIHHESVKKQLEILQTSGEQIKK